MSAGKRQVRRAACATSCGQPCAVQHVHAPKRATSNCNQHGRAPKHPAACAHSNATCGMNG
eukprot:6235887-Alexandrium_andersonii.AAC.1